MSTNTQPRIPVGRPDGGRFASFAPTTAAAAAPLPGVPAAEPVNGLVARELPGGRWGLFHAETGAGIFGSMTARRAYPSRTDAEAWARDQYPFLRGVRDRVDVKMRERGMARPATSCGTCGAPTDQEIDYDGPRPVIAVTCTRCHRASTTAA